MRDHLPGNNNWWLSACHFLNSKRLSYALITGAILWILWLVSVSCGPGILDLSNQVVGTDYIQFYVSGLTLRQGNSADLYNFNFQAQLEISVAGSEFKNFHANLTPPFFAWLFVPLSVPPYIWSFIIWTIVSLLALWVSIKMISKEITWHAYLWAISWFPIFAVISFGQNSLIALLILSATYKLWKWERSLLAGLIASLLFFKPQLLIGIVILWMIRWRKDWAALLGLIIGVCLLCGFTILYLPDSVTAYIQLVRNYLPGMIYRDQFPLYHMHALRGFWALLLHNKPWLVETLSIFVSIIGIGVYIRFVFSNKNRLAICFGAAIAITILVTPHAMIYDWALLIIPAILLWQEIPELKPYWKVVYALIWVVTLLSGPLTFMQQQAMPIALQFSVPVYFLIFVDVMRTLRNYISPEPFHCGFPGTPEGSV